MQGGWQPPPGGGGGYGGGQPSGGGYGPPPGAPGGTVMGGPPAGYGAQPPGYGAPPNPYASPGAMPGMGMGMGSYGNYEFNDMENQIIDKVAGRAKLWGIISTVIGILQTLGSCTAVASPGAAVYLPLGIVGIIIGVTFMGVGTSLKNVVNTQGNDVAHMMQALQKLGSAFMIQIVCTIICVVMVVLFMILAIFVLAVAA